jgi:high-affinity iron transporter
MLGTAVIVFREVLEASLIIGLVLAITRGIEGRIRLASIGVFFGLLGAVILALLADQITPLAEGMGSELLNASILSAAVLMLSWHLIWMRKHSQAITHQIKQVGNSIVQGEKPPTIIAVIIGLAILREGSEVVLLMYGVSAAGSDAMGMLSGGVVGLLAGITIGVIMYLGLARIPLSTLFRVSGWLLLLLTAGLAAQASNYLVQADMLPALGYNIWDTSNILSERSLLGQFLHILIGYVAQPTGIQILVYVSTMIVVGMLSVIITNPTRFKLNAARASISAVVIMFTLILTTQNSHASHKIYSPYVEKGEYEIEVRGHTTFDNDASKDSKEKVKVDIGYGVTDYWFTAYVANIEEDANGDLDYNATAWENIFQLTEQGEYWLDLGLYLEYEFAHDSGTNDKIEGKLLLEKNIGRYVNTANLIFARSIGSGASNETEFEYAWRTKYLLNKAFEPGIEIYGAMGEFGHVLPSDQQDHRLGPVFSGVFAGDSHSKWVYEAGYLFGVSDAAPDGTIKVVIEYEFR